MNKEQIPEIMDFVDDDLLERSEQKTGNAGAILRWGALAACLGLVIFGAAFLFGRTPEKPNDRHTEQKVQLSAQQTTPPDRAEAESNDRQWTPVYNRYTERVELDLSRALNPGYFYEDVDGDQLEQILPQRLHGLI